MLSERKCTTESNTVTDRSGWTQNPGVQHNCSNTAKASSSGTVIKPDWASDWSISKKDNITGGLTYNHWGNYSKGVTSRIPWYMIQQDQLAVLILIISMQPITTLEFTELEPELQTQFRDQRAGTGYSV